MSRPEATLRLPLGYAEWERAVTGPPPSKNRT